MLSADQLGLKDGDAVFFTAGRPDELSPSLPETHAIELAKSSS